MMDEEIPITDTQSLLSTTSEEHNQNLEEQVEDLSSEQIKFTIKQRLGRLLMTTEIKDKSLVPDLIKIKNDMYENFCRTGVWKSSYINNIFRLYAHKNQDINIVKPQLKLFSQYAVSIPDISEKDSLKVTTYIKTLKFIRAGLYPTLHDIQSLVSDAKRYASDEIKTENTEIFHTGYELEDEQQREHVIAKQYLQKLLSSQYYNQDRFIQQQRIMSDSFETHMYQDLMIFALLGFHYFQRKYDVYAAFSSEYLQTKMISFTLPGFHPTTIPLGSFLKIIEHLDFKKHTFSF